MQSAKLNNPQKPAKTMADLLQSSKSVIAFKKGAIIDGIVSRITPQEIFLNIGGKGEALVLEKERNLFKSLISFLRIGDKVSASVLNPESENGYVVVSLRRFLEDKTWEKFKILQKSNTPIEVMVSALVKGGFLVATKEGLSGFVPYSQSLNLSNKNIVNTNINVYVAEINKEEHKIIFSQKKPVSEEAFEKIKKELKIDQKITATITSISPFGLFVSVTVLDNSLDGLVHISEISWEKSEDLEEKFEIDQKIEVALIGIDTKAKRLDFSIKRLTKDPFQDLIKKYSVEKKIKGTVSKISSMGVALNLEEGVEGLIRKEKIPPTTNYKVGDEISATVSEVDASKHKIYLTPVLLEKPIGYR